jgi:hypothetical protein
MTKRNPALTLEEAESIAAQGLAFLAEEPARFVGFLTLTGLTPEDIRARVGAPEVLAAVLEHLSTDESLLLTFAATASVAPESIVPALAMLQGNGWRA